MSRGEQVLTTTQILPPPLYTAIDSSIQYPGADSHSTQSQQHHRPSISGQPSPNYSQSSSMPDSFDDFSHRNHEPVYQISAPQRPPHATNINQQYPDMAASYSTHRPQYHQPQQLGMRGSPGLPPIRDIDQGFGKFNNYDNDYMGSNGFSPMYGQPLNSTSQYGESYMSRRPSGPSYYDNKPVSQTYPPSNRPYPPIKPEPQSQYQPTSSYDTFNPREGFGYPYTSVGMPQAPPMYHPGGDTGDSRNRRRRGNLPKQITDVLRAWFQDHLDHPYPSEEEKQMFINTTGLSMNQVSV